MKKQILNIGKALKKAEQKIVFGGELNPEGCYVKPFDDLCGCNYNSDCSSDNCHKIGHVSIGVCKAA